MLSHFFRLAVYNKSLRFFIAKDDIMALLGFVYININLI